MTDYRASVAAEDLPVLTEPAILRNVFAEHFRRCVAESPANAQFTVNTGGSSSCISVSASMNPMPQPVRSQCLAIADVDVEKDGVGSSAIVQVPDFPDVTLATTCFRVVKRNPADWHTVPLCREASR